MRAVGSAVVCMSVAEVPDGRQRSPYLVRWSLQAYGRLELILG